jgi:TolB-like protein/DNA-binding winged helix-turn-helix (wHTH) protein/Flp pilus assembly protein TadD
VRKEFDIGNWRVRPHRGLIESGDDVVHLKPKPMAVLECLARSGNEVVTRDELFDAVWPGGVVSDATLTQCIVELRKAFGDSAQEPRIIQTVPKVGFCLIPPVKSLCVDEASAGPPVNEATTMSRRSARWVGLAVLIIAIAIVIQTVRERGEPTPGPNPGTATASEQPSIAVLPFVNMSDEPGNDYFAEGLSEELRNLLARKPGLNVAASTSSQSLYHQGHTIAQIAAALDVGHVLEGSVRKSGDQIRIALRMVDASNGFDVWAQSYDRTLDDILVVQDEIAVAVLDALPADLVGEAWRERETDTQVYSLYLQALYFTKRATAEGMSRAVTRLQQALALDPDYAPALALLATAYLYQANGGARDFDEGFELGRATAIRALEIDPELSHAWGVLAYIESYYDWNWEQAGHSIRNMIELNPSDAVNLNGAATFHTMMGEFDRSLELRERAIRKDPVNVLFMEAKAFNLITVGRVEEADEVLRELLEFQPAHVNAQLLRAKARLLSGSPEGALELVQGLRSEDDRIKSLVATALHQAGQVEQAESLMQTLAAKAWGEEEYARALFSAWTGDHELAFEHLHQALEQGHRVLAYVLGEPLLYPLHDDPRWQAFLAEMDLLEAWLKVPAAHGGPEITKQ